MTFRRTLARTLGHNLAAVLVLAALVLFSLANTDKPSVDRPAPVGSAQALTETHECGDFAKDPTHAVITVDGVTRYVGKRLTDQAIEQAMFGIDHGMTVHAFCP